MIFSGGRESRPGTLGGRCTDGHTETRTDTERGSPVRLPPGRQGSPSLLPQLLKSRRLQQTIPGGDSSPLHPNTRQDHGTAAARLSTRTPPNIYREVLFVPSLQWIYSYILVPCHGGPRIKQNAMILLLIGAGTQFFFSLNSFVVRILF